ncbi:MAG: MFS transporter [Caulobacteraceae bacterium]
MAHDAPPLPATAEAAAPDGAAPQGRKAALAFIFVTVTIDTIAMGVTAPVLPQLIERLSGSASQAGWMNGLFMTVFALMQFLFSPILGGLSDRYGRRPILLLSIAGLGLSYLGMGLATSVWQLLLIRMFAGATSANIATAFAYIADVTPPDRRAGAYGLMQAAMSLGFALGPGIGGLLGGVDPAAPFWAAAGFSLLNAVYGYFVVPESLGKDRRAPFHLKKMGSFSAMSVLTSNPELFRLAMILVLPSSPPWCSDRLRALRLQSLSLGHRRGGRVPDRVRRLLGAGPGGALGRAVRMFGEAKVILFGLLCGALGAFAFGYAPTAIFFAIAIPIMTLSGTSGPAIQSLMTRLVSSSEQGRLQGANTSVQSVAGIIAPLLFGGVYSAAVGAWRGIGLRARRSSWRA